MVPEPGPADSGAPLDVPPEVVPGTLSVSGELAPLVDALAADIDSASVVHGAAILMASGDGVSLHDEATGAVVALPATQQTGALQLDAHTALLLLDDALQVWDGTYLRSSPLQDVLPLPAESMAGHAEMLWFVAGGRVFQYADGLLSAVQIGESPQVRLLAASGDSRVAVMAPHLLVLDGFGGEVSLLDHQPDRLATSLSFDADGSLWLADGSSVVARRSRSGDWGELDAGEAVEAVAGHPTAPDLWLRTASGALHHRDGAFHTVAVPDGDWVGVDPLGRLLVLGDAGLQRVAARRAVAVSGLQAGALLDAPATLAFAPTGPDTTTALDVWVGTTALALHPDLGTVQLDPVSLPPGDHVLRITAEGPEGVTLTDLPFRTGELPDADWDNDVLPIMEQHCSRCHGEGAGIPLNTADLWRINIDRILVEVVSQDMPLGGPYLSDDELALIRGWQAGGFP